MTDKLPINYQRMAKKGGENSRKVAGNAKKAENANKKKEVEAAKAEASEEEKWSQGSKKGNKKKEDEAEKKREAAKKKAEREALLKEEESSLPSKPSKRGSDKIASKRANKIDSFLDFNEAPEVSASGIEGALEALSFTNKAGISDKDIDRHPERRVKAAFAAYEERRAPEIKAENPGLRQQQVKNLIFKEFQKSSENPMNQATNISFNANRDDVVSKKQEIQQTREKKFTR